MENERLCLNAAGCAKGEMVEEGRELVDTRIRRVGCCLSHVCILVDGFLGVNALIASSHTLDFAFQVKTNRRAGLGTSYESDETICMK
jgi:hypothetical protein